MKIVTYNIACGWSWDSINSMQHRIGMIWEKIRTEKPDVIAFQEIVPIARDCLEDMFHDYMFLGHMRGADYDGEGLFTAIRRDAWELLAYDTFWLSPTPYVPGSRYENQSECPRICVVTAVRNKKTGERIRLYNLHLDHISDEARVEGMGCILGYMHDIEEKNPMESILLGDFNARAGSNTIALCKNYPYRHLTDATSDLAATFHNFGSAATKIDYMFVTDGLLSRAKKAVVWDDVHKGIYLSDHYPVAVEFED